MCEEDRRAAANITAGLSGQLIAASLAMLAIEGAVVSFVYGQREPSVAYTVLTFISAIAFISSIFIAGKGITKLRNSVATSSWTTTSGQKLFDWQAVANIIGLFLFFLSAFFVGSKQDNEVDKRFVLVTEKYVGLKNELDSLTAANKIINIRLNDLKEEINKLRALSCKPSIGCEKNHKKRRR